MLGAFSNPRWQDAGHTKIVLDTTWNGKATTYLASGSDVNANGRAIYNQAVLGAYGAVAEYSAPVSPAPTKSDLYAAANAKADSLLAANRTYDLGGVSVAADATTATGVNLTALNIWAQANPSSSRVWVDNFGVRTTLTAAQVQTLAFAVLAYATEVYDPGLKSVLDAIDAGSITTLAGVAAASWPA